MSEIYQPEEDSYLLQKATKKFVLKNKPQKVLEIGSGSGFQLENLKKLGVKEIIGTDINSEAVKHCKNLGVNCIKSDLFKNIKGKFDLIIFNPPYLPEDKNEPKSSRLATTGGKKGSEIINRFLKEAHKFLKTNGEILLLVSNLTKGIKWGVYTKKIILRKKLFFEELYIYELCIKE